MNSLSKEKRNQLVLVIILSIGVVAGLWFGLIRSQQQTLEQLAQSKRSAQQKLEQVRQAIETADAVEMQLGEANKRLAKIESTMASGDLYLWTINTLRQFKPGYRVEIPQFSQIDGPKDMNLLPNFPYKQANMTISGSALYSDLGRFVADFENQFPYMRILNLTLEPIPSMAGERERLSFRMEIATLVKNSAS
ncbi:MAG TPA: hypothetical protein VKY92_12395 [Verrucomicrobiae bacterium]|nr:hypothetical protein [Verrucomicrobiae bacterium]